MITFNAINHAYPGEAEQALADLSLEFGDPTVTVLVGPNNSGKATLIQILSDLLPSSSEGVSINGTDMRPDDLLGYSVMASSDRDFDNFSVGALVAYASLRPTWDQRLFDHHVQRFGLQMKRHRKPHKVSSSQAAVLTGAVALVSGAPVTVLDEIQAPLNMPVRYASYEELLTLTVGCMEGRHPRRTFLISSHMVSELENVVGDVVTLKNGRLLAHESVDAFTSYICAITGNTASVEGFLIDHPGAPVISSRTFRSARKIVVDLRDCGIADREIASYSLILSPCSFQDAFAYLIQEKDQWSL